MLFVSLLVAINRLVNLIISPKLSFSSSLTPKRRLFFCWKLQGLGSLHQMVAYFAESRLQKLSSSLACWEQVSCSISHSQMLQSFIAFSFRLVLYCTLLSLGLMELTLRGTATGPLSPICSPLPWRALPWWNSPRIGTLGGVGFLAVSRHIHT